MLFYRNIVLLSCLVATMSAEVNRFLRVNKDPSKDSFGKMRELVEDLPEGPDPPTVDISLSHGSSEDVLTCRDVVVDIPPFLAQANFGAPADTTNVFTAINAWIADGGGDGPEGQFYALYEIATNTSVASWDPAKVHVVVWFGDAPGHDPICKSVTGLAEDITEASLTKALQDQHILLIAISTPTGYVDGLDDVHNSGDSSPELACPLQASGPGQATRLTKATNGLALKSTVEGIVDTVVNAVTTVIPPPLITVAPVVDSCDTGLTVAFTPPSADNVAPGSKPCITETISITDSCCSCAADTTPLTCSVQFIDQNSATNIGSPQSITVHPTSVDTTPPVFTRKVALCLWSPYHKYFDYTDFLHSNEFFQFDTATDDCGVVTPTFVSCSSSQPSNCHGDGSTAKDCYYDEETDTLRVRSERQGTAKGGRFYNVIVNLTDNCYNTITTNSSIWIPRDTNEVKASPFKSVKNCQRAV